MVEEEIKVEKIRKKQLLSRKDKVNSKILYIELRTKNSDLAPIMSEDQY